MTSAKLTLLRRQDDEIIQRGKEKQRSKAGNSKETQAKYQDMTPTSVQQNALKTL